ncbi:MAG: SDR family oxidoreductase [Henriciella sp.]|nr:SDR family oxidoreductase [Henriciella sp.]
MESYKDKVVVITGGATGIGFAFAKAFGSEGAKIVIGEQRENRLQEAVEALKQLDVEASYTVCDVADYDSVEALADFAWDRYGQVDVLINNAGIAARRKPLPDMPMEEVRKLFDVNFFGVWHGSAVFGRRMRDQGTPAAIFNVGSENSFFSAVPRSTAYLASKHAVHGLTEGLREDLPDFITVGMIVPGWVRSELGDPSVAHMAMDADEFVGICMPQMKAGNPYIVSHAYNMEHVRDRYETISEAYAKYAPRYEGDDEYDVRTLIRKMAEARERNI